MVTADSILALIMAYRTSFRNPHDKIALAVHASFLASGCILVATGLPAFSDTVLSSPSTDEVGMECNGKRLCFPLPQRGKRCQEIGLRKMFAMGVKLIVDALVVGGGEEKRVTLQIDVLQV
ncbi:probable proteasome inhibitor [Telopea speciosissima]|uniref:probable proteasome inhibitor n=1 Tax=Telopea speciosissima TaxID=54955 RepID=UPI001CC7DE9D|nr:probable proteasome inhibitor [Telopea speciosissima]